MKIKYLFDNKWIEVKGKLPAFNNFIYLYNESFEIDSIGLF